METLYILGNGFDLHHDVASKYSNFKRYLERQDPELLFHLENLYDCEDIWADFENNLLTISRETLIKWITPFLPPNEVGDDDFTYAELYLSQDHIGDLVDQLTQNLRKRFHQWIRTLIMPTGNEQKFIDIDKNALFLSFNYTDFIEKVYDVPAPQICYLHGKKSDKLGDIILGHGESPENTYEYWVKVNRKKRRFQPQLKSKKKYYKNPSPTYLAYFLEDETKGTWGSEARYHAINFAVARIEDYFEQSYKNFNKVLETHKVFIASLNGINKIIVMGHSLSKVDIPYFKKLLEVNIDPQSIRWEISYHSDSTFSKIDEFADELKINPGNIEKFKMVERLSLR